MNNPFINKKVSKLYKIFSFVYLWTNLVLFSSEILGSIEFNGFFIIWMSGLPFIALIVGFEREKGMNFVLNLRGRFKSGAEIERHLH